MDNNALKIVQRLLDLNIEEQDDAEFGKRVRKVLWEMIHSQNANY